MRIVRLTDETKQNILDDLLKRSPSSYGAYEETVNRILADVRARGDEAVFAYTREFDKCELTKDTLTVTEEEIEEAYGKLDNQLVDAMRKAAENIRAFHEKQIRQSFFTTKPDGTILGQRITPLARAGVYVPGGKAAYPSSVLMNVIPARVAGVAHLHGDAAGERRESRSRHARGGRHCGG